MKLNARIVNIKKSSKRNSGFTLLQILLVTGIIAILGAVTIGVLGRTHGPANRSKCSSHLNEIALALDTYRQERGHMPVALADLVKDGYIAPEILRCPSDPDLAKYGNDKNYTSYGDYYAIREPRDSGELPVLVCPFHENDGGYGEQAYKGGFTEQFATHPATLAGGDYSGVVTITRAGGNVLTLPEEGQILELHGGDHIKTGAGEATIHFADTSTANIVSNTELTVMQSFVEGRRSNGLYTMVNQSIGKVNYYVRPGSRFDVVTPTATAGALGTRFTVEVFYVNVGTSTPLDLAEMRKETKLTVTEHVVALSTVNRTIDVSDTEAPVYAHAPENIYKPRRPRDDGASDPLPDPGSPGATPTSAPAPTATPVVAPTATPSPNPTATPNPTSTPVPTSTPIPTSTPVPTSTPQPQPTATARPTSTPVPAATPTPTPKGKGKHKGKHKGKNKD